VPAAVEVLPEAALAIETFPMAAAITTAVRSRLLIIMLSPVVVAKAAKAPSLSR